MATLRNPKHEMLAQHLANGESAAKAHVLAGFKENRHNASARARSEPIKSRVAEILNNRNAKHVLAAERAVERLAITTEGLIEEAEEIRKLAIEDKQFAAANAALVSKAKLAGKWIERSEVGRPGEFDHMTDDQLRSYIVATSVELGLGNETVN